MNVGVTFEVEGSGVDADAVRRAVSSTLEAEGSDLALELVIVDDERIHEINRAWLDHDHPTDVIAFDLRDDHGGPDGEIYVSAVTAAREAVSRGIDPAAELLLYCVHGTLHLLGYDDHEPEDRDRMHARQAELLRGLGYETDR